MRLVLTEKLLRTLRVEVQTDVWDASRPAFGLRVTPAGSKTWQVMYTSPLTSKRRRIAIGYWPELGLETARQRATNLLKEVEAGKDPVETAGAASERLRFSTLAANFLTLYAKPRKKTWREDERRIKRFLLPAWADRWADTVTRRDVVRLLDGIAATAPIEANRVLAVVSKMFNWALGRDDVQSNPAHMVPKPGVTVARDRALSDDEIVKVWRACEAERRAGAVALLLILTTAQRPGMVERMRWENIDETGWWTIPASSMKAKRVHLVYLSPLSLRLLAGRRRLAKVSPWVFPMRDEPNKPIAYGRGAHRRVVEACGLPHWTAHDLRRTAATGMRRAGVSRETVVKVLSHVDRSVTGVYDRYDSAPELRAAQETWSRYLADLLGLGDLEAETQPTLPGRRAASGGGPSATSRSAPESRRARQAAGPSGG